MARGAAAAAAIWSMRKKSVGLLGNMQGERRPMPFVEDTVVPPENLADYIQEFRAVLDRRGLVYGMFGHVDAGVLLWSYANRAQKFADAQMALKALYRHVGARQALRDLFDQHVDLESASETDRALLRCVFLDPERDGRSV